MNLFFKATRKLVALWFDYQVELHGEYSLERLRKFDAYAKTASLLRVIAVCGLTPLPNLAIITLIDCVPLAHPNAGTNANYVHWLRNFFTVILITWTVIVQFKHTVPGLTFTTTRMIMLSLTPSVLSVAFEYAVSLIVGFPLPFAMVVGTPLWSAVVLALFAYYFRHALQANAQLRTDLINYTFVFFCQISLTFIYPAYIYGFVSIDASVQTVYIALLPILKIALKNWMSKFLGDLDDLKPEIVIFNVEIFNALYVACCMQQSSSITTTLVISGIDLAQAMLSLRDIFAVHADVQQFMVLIPPTHAWHGKTFVEVALTIIDEDADVRAHPSLRQVCAHTGTAVLATLRSAKRAKATHTPNAPRRSTRIAPSPAVPNKSRTCETSVVPGERAEAALSSTAQRVQFVKCVNKLLFTSEFVVLVEYTEVIVPLIYSLYVAAVYHLQNRAYYKQIATLETHEIQDRIANVMVYSGLEFLSFLLVSATLRRKLGVATFKQLTFVLEKQWAVVQSKLLLWLVYAVQTSLDHIGADYSFQFRWLHTPAP